MALTSEERLGLSLGVTVVILVAEVVGGLLSNSLALLSDAGHNLTDAFALGLSLIAVRISKRPSDYRATYGYQRVGLLVAVVNGLGLLIIALFVFVESYRRLTSPPQIDLPLMLTIAVLGLVGNLAATLVIGRGHVDLNIRSAWLHLLGDTVSSAGVIVSGIIIHFTGWLYADPIAGVMIGIGIVAGGAGVVKEALIIFLEMAPKGFHSEEIAKRICDMPEVMGVHDIHLWSVVHQRIAFSAHIWVHDQKLSELESIRKKIEHMLTELGIGHIILQFECAECQNGGLYCQLPDQPGYHGETAHHHHSHHEGH
jgi:cobalt-zinc-cadmium efflux system protein